MMKLTWLTDIHLNFIAPYKFDGLMGEIVRHTPDAVLISGDIGESSSVAFYLQRMAKVLARPIYFVLGNHDYYRGSFEAVSAAVRVACGQSPHLVWLNDAGVVALSPGVALIGHDSWADGRLGDYARSAVEMNDYRLIEDFVGLEKPQRLALLNQRGDAAASHFQNVLPRALRQARQVYLLTHVPPFAESCLYEGQPGSNDFLPHFGCKAVGDVLVEIMQAHPDKQLTVLCGHTHQPAHVHILPNLWAITGGADYGKPRVEQAFTSRSGILNTF